MNAKVLENDFLDAIDGQSNLKVVSEKLNISYTAVLSRFKRLKEKGIISIIDGKYKVLETNDNTSNNESDNSYNTEKEEVPTVKGYKPDKNPQDSLGNPNVNNKIKIDTSGSSEGLRFLKDNDTLERIDIIMSQMRETDSFEIKNMFRGLVCKIFEASLK